MVGRLRICAAQCRRYCVLLPPRWGEVLVMTCVHVIDSIGSWIPVCLSVQLSFTGTPLTCHLEKKGLFCLSKTPEGVFGLRYILFPVPSYRAAPWRSS